MKVLLFIFFTKYIALFLYYNEGYIDILFSDYFSFFILHLKTQMLVRTSVGSKIANGLFEIYIGIYLYIILLLQFKGFLSNSIHSNI